MFCFAVCEWNAVYCADRLRPGSVRAFVKDELTAGKIAQKLGNLARNMPKVPEREQIIAAAQEFKEVILLRNKIIHGKPCTGPNGKQRLSNRKILEIVDLENAADSFTTCSIELNRLLHGFLSTYKPK